MLLNTLVNQVVVIPARMGSSRFPGKPLTEILGKSMLSWVIQHSIEAVGASNTYVATCDEEIMSEANRCGVQGILTSSSHERATDRTAEALHVIERQRGKLDAILMLQGDEPTIQASSIRRALDYLQEDTRREIVNLIGPINSDSEWKDPNCIKVLSSSDSVALYLSRAPVPHGAVVGKNEVYKQVCAIAFQRNSLLEFANQTLSILENLESIDMLRWIDAGRKIHLCKIKDATHPVDVPLDVSKVEEILLKQ
jgi:3-deoxy-manno-octulosonate cytidylyltransferase (CMP-KDO synthetase)